jgi:hypothetical protein
MSQKNFQANPSSVLDIAQNVLHAKMMTFVLKFGDLLSNLAALSYV